MHFHQYKYLDLQFYSNLILKIYKSVNLDTALFFLNNSIDKRNRQGNRSDDNTKGRDGYETTSRNTRDFILRLRKPLKFQLK